MSTFDQLARDLVDQHYAAGPDDLKLAIAKALQDTAQHRQDGSDDPQQRLLSEIDELEGTPERGSE